MVIVVWLVLGCVPLEAWAYAAAVLVGIGLALVELAR